MDNNGQHWTTMDNNGQQRTTIRGTTCISDAVFVLVLIESIQSIQAVSDGLLFSVNVNVLNSAVLVLYRSNCREKPETHQKHS